MPGFVITSWGTEAISEAGAIDLMNTTDRSLLQAAWEVLSHDGSRSVVVRSSSSGEDMEGSSVAGRFRSILGVDSWSSFKEAVHDVLASADHIDLERDLERGLMAVLVQPELKPALGGVMFGLDPVTGREDRLIASAVRGGPERLVAGEVDGAHYTLSRGGRLISGPERGTDRPLRSRHRRRLAKLAFEAQCIFGRPQNVEWAFDDQGKLWLFQSGPITATPSLP
jgi:pyruvate,water dikinase